MGGPLLALLITAGALLSASAVCLAQGEHARRVGAELLVLRGDLRRLGAAKFTDQQKRGLADRIRGTMAGLDLLARLADQEAGRPPRAETHRNSVAALRQAFEADTLQEDNARLGALIDAFPLRMTGLTPTPASAPARGRALHEELCAACHDAPDLALERPAYNLFAEAKRLSPAEFAARLLVGVRGDRVTGIDNPLMDRQIADLIAFYRQGP